MRTFRRVPVWTVTIRRPDYTSTSLAYVEVPEWSRGGTKVDKIQFVSAVEKADGISNYTDCVEYSYENALGNPAGKFSLSLMPRQDSNGLTWADKLEPNDLVSISEFGKVRYIGLVRMRSYSSSMDASGKPSRKVTISGESIGGRLQTFNLPMNTYLWYQATSDADLNNKKFIHALNSNLEEDQTIEKMVTLIIETFLRVVTGRTNGGFQTILNNYFSIDSEDLKVHYPMNIKPFDVNSNNLWSIVKSILPDPIYEVFGRYKNEKYNIVCREVPFDTAKWDGLRITELDPLHLISQNLSTSDGEVYTHYFSQMPNAVFSKNALYASTDLPSVSVFDTEKLGTYGYKEMEAIFPFFNKVKGKNKEYKEFLKENSVRLYAWFKNNLEFYSGTITMMTVPDENNEYISIGERIKYLKGSSNSIEFYVESVKRTMNYPGTMKTTYGVTRGYEYGSETVTVDSVTVNTPQVKKISKMCVKLIQAEKEAL